MSNVACNSVDPTDGIGIGAGQVNSALCNAGTIAGGVNVDTAMFADPVYLTTTANANFGSYAYDRIHERF